MSPEEEIKSLGLPPDQEAAALAALGNEPAWDEARQERSKAALDDIDRVNAIPELEQDVDENGVSGPMAASALQGASFGFGDEIGGGASALLRKAMGNKQSLSELYGEDRDALRNYLGKAVEGHRVANIAGGVAGGIAGARAIGGLVNAVRGGTAAAGTVPTAMTLGKGAATGAKAGAAMGAIQGLGDAKDLGADALVRTGVGALAGGATGGVLGGASAKLGQYLTPEVWQTIARKFGLFSAGELAKKQSKELGREGIEETADYILNNVIPNIPMAQRTRAGVAAKIEQMLTEKNEYLGKTISDPLDDLTRTLGLPGGVRQQDVARALGREASEYEGMGAGEQLANAYSGLASGFEKAAEKTGGAMNLAKTRAEKALLRDGLKSSLRAQNSDVTASSRAEAQRSAYNTLRKLEDEHVMSSADKIDRIRERLAAYLADKNKPRLPTGEVAAPQQMLPEGQVLDQATNAMVRSEIRPGIAGIDLASKLKSNVPENNTGWVFGKGAPPPRGPGPNIDSMADKLRFDKAANIVDQFPQGVSAAYQPLKRELKNLYSAEQLGTERMLRDYSNSPYGIGGAISGAEEATGGLVTGGLQNAFGGALRGKIGSGVSKFVDEVSAPQIATAANWMAKNADTAAGKAAKSFIVNSGAGPNATFAQLLKLIKGDDT
jgi:hypothetical protein